MVKISLEYWDKEELEEVIAVEETVRRERLGKGLAHFWWHHQETRVICPCGMTPMSPPEPEPEYKKCPGGVGCVCASN